MKKGKAKKGAILLPFFLIAVSSRFTGAGGLLGESSLLLGTFLLGALAARPGTSKTGANSRSLNAVSRWFHQDMTL